jgi:hypothetical protein
MHGLEFGYSILVIERRDHTAECCVIRPGEPAHSTIHADLVAARAHGEAESVRLIAMTAPEGALQ